MVTLEISSPEMVQPTIDKFWESIPPVWSRIKNNLRSIAGDEFGVSVEQFHILRHVRRGLGSVSELAQVRQISRPAISQLVNTLVEKDLVKRSTSRDDRRCIRLELTPEGGRLLDTIFEKNRRWMAQKMAVLNADEHRQLIEALDLLKRSFEYDIA